MPLVIASEISYMLVWSLVLVLRSKVKYLESYRGHIQEYPKKNSGLSFLLEQKELKSGL